MGIMAYLAVVHCACTLWLNSIHTINAFFALLRKKRGKVERVVIVALSATLRQHSSLNAPSLTRTRGPRQQFSWHGGSDVRPTIQSGRLCCSLSVPVW
ncbi:hypothetical protein BV22DRAFT_65039 [Leucogyrophana mollusca]|uniref:Uncharacterized protein n=1 Tax=Leucogyrophana mollusca TaxID=85980 RepID=A0ACB8BXT3_9AGAM|nr:hypothetical protein BV22DRAFT_65039 [Leucogyrophana mollusca]